MERKNSRSVSLKKKHAFYGKDVFPDACLISGCVSGNNLWIPLCYIASGGSKISNKTRPLDSVLLYCLRRVKDLKKTHPRNKNTHI